VGKTTCFYARINYFVAAEGATEEKLCPDNTTTDSPGQSKCNFYISIADLSLMLATAPLVNLYLGDVIEAAGMNTSEVAVVLAGLAVHPGQSLSISPSADASSPLLDNSSSGSGVSSSVTVVLRGSAMIGNSSLQISGPNLELVYEEGMNVSAESSVTLAELSISGRTLDESAEWPVFRLGGKLAVSSLVESVQMALEVQSTATVEVPAGADWQFNGPLTNNGLIKLDTGSQANFTFFDSSSASSSSSRRLRQLTTTEGGGMGTGALVSTGAVYFAENSQVSFDVRILGTADAEGGSERRRLETTGGAPTIGFDGSSGFGGDLSFGYRNTTCAANGLANASCSTRTADSCTVCAAANAACCNVFVNFLGEQSCSECTKRFRCPVDSLGMTCAVESNTTGAPIDSSDAAAETQVQYTNVDCMQSSTALVTAAESIRFKGVTSTAVYLNCLDVSTDFDIVLAHARVIELGIGATLPTLACYTRAGEQLECSWSTGDVIDFWDYDRSQAAQKLTATVHSRAVGPVVEPTAPKACFIGLTLAVLRDGGAKGFDDKNLTLLDGLSEKIAEKWLELEDLTAEDLTVDDVDVGTPMVMASGRVLQFDVTSSTAWLKQYDAVKGWTVTTNTDDQQVLTAEMSAMVLSFLKEPLGFNCSDCTVDLSTDSFTSASEGCGDVEDYTLQWVMAFFILLSLGIAISLLTLRYFCREKRTYHWQSALRAISSTLSMQPTEDEEGEEFYKVRNGADYKQDDPKGLGPGTPLEKLVRLKQMREENIAILTKAFNGPYYIGRKKIKNLKRITKYENVKDFKFYVVQNLKTDESILAKATRPDILVKYPKYEIDHIRDALRFKCVVNNLFDGFTFLQYLICLPGWKVVKLDLVSRLQV
jgi:hypothetical protein